MTDPRSLDAELFKRLVWNEAQHKIRAKKFAEAVLPDYMQTPEWRERSRKAVLEAMFSPLGIEALKEVFKEDDP